MANIGNVPVFNHNKNDWGVFKTQIKQFLIVNELEDGGPKVTKKKRAILINALAEETFILLKNLMHPSDPAADTTTYENIISALDAHFKPSTSGFAERKKFYDAEKCSEETLQQWAARLRALAVTCEFGEHLEMMLRDRFIMGLPKGAVKDKLFLEKVDTLTFAKAMEIASSVECVLNQYQPMAVKQEVEVFKMAKKQFKKADNKKSREQSRCTVCGLASHTEDRCRYRTYKCNKCGQKGHLKKMCKDKSNIKINECNFTENKVKELPLFNFRANTHKPILINITVEGVPMSAEIDSGASVSAMSEEIYTSIFKKKFKLLPAKELVKSYNGNEIKIKGTCMLNVRFENRTEKIIFFVIPKGGPVLLGRDMMNKFSLGIRQINKLEVKNEALENLLDKYSELFDKELGTFTYHEISLQLKPNSIPKSFRPRRVPFAIREKVEAEIDKLTKMGVLEPVEISEWCTPIVPVLKKNGDVRICGDFKITVNPHLMVPQYPLPKIEELFAGLHGGKIFAKLDLSTAYQQLVLDEESRKLTTIATTKGLFRYTRLVYGLASAPAIFQKIMENLLSGVQGVQIFLDDILISGTHEKELLNRLYIVFKILSKAGFKVAKEKCEFFVTSVSYLGHVIDRNGLHMDEKRVKAIEGLSKPQSVKQLQSFLGIVNFYRSFVPQMATVAAPLNELLSCKKQWNWGKAQDDSFESIKRLLSSKQVLAHYDPNVEVKLIVDASPVGIAGALIHKYSDGTAKPIAFASRSLSATEKRYAQLEKEALAITYGVQKFHQYLFGRKFVLVSDNKPLIAIFGPKKGIPERSANKLQRYALFLSGYDFSLEYINTKDNLADYFSRSPVEPAVEEDKDDIYLNYVIESGKLPISFENIQKITTEDRVLSKVIEYCRTGWPNKMEEEVFKPYFSRKEELSIEEDCLFWGCRVIIPEKLRRLVLGFIHETHMGIVKMKSITRSYCWWPSLDRDLEEITGSCVACLKFRSYPPRVQLENWPLPKEAWQRIHLDFMGPIFGQSFLILVDAYSKWLDCIDMGNSITAGNTIKKLRVIFAQFGLPQVIVTDNGTAFVSEEFKKFLRGNGIQHITSPVGNPATNGQAENGVKTVKLALKKALLNKSPKVDLDRVLQGFLLDYRNTPHCTTGIEPALILFNRRLRNRFDVLKPNKDLNNKDSNINAKNKIIEANVKNAQDKQKKNYRGRDRKGFKIDEIVMVKDYSKPGKQTWVNGIVRKKIGKVYYKIELIEKNGVFWKRHINQIWRCKNPKGNQCEDTYVPIPLLDPYTKIEVQTNENNRASNDVGVEQKRYNLRNSKVIT